MKRGISKYVPNPSKILRQGKDVKTRKGRIMKNGILYDVIFNVAKGHQDGLRAYGAHAVGTPTTKIGKAFGVANVLIGAAAFTIGMYVIDLKAYEAGASLGDRMKKKVRMLKERKRKMREREEKSLSCSDEAKEGLEEYIGKCRNTVSFADMEDLADRAVKRAETRDLTDEEAEELGL